MLRAISISLFDLVLGLSEAVDLVSDVLHMHQQKVAYISYRLGLELKLSYDELSTLTIAAALHDIGAITLSERLKSLDFEDNSQLEHQERGYHILRTFEPLEDAADIIRYHHNRWNDNNASAPYESNIVYLADRVSVLVNSSEDIMAQKQKIVAVISEQSGVYFDPVLVEAFKKLAKNESFWIELSLPTINQIIADRVGTANIYLNDENLLGISKLFSRIIDFRSRFTSTHSSGVAATAKQLGRMYNLSYNECLNLEIAGYLHDLGKLSVPTEILEKDGSLTPPERNVIQRHTYFTYKILDRIKQLKAINECACLHHERMDGRGYPFGFNGDQLPLCSRIMAVADVFTAVTESRPYRAGMNMDQAIAVLKGMADNGGLDREITKLAISNYEILRQTCLNNQKIAAKEYEEFDKSIQRSVYQVHSAMGI